MNNVICCQCLDCANEFTVGVPDLLDQDQDAVIGDIVWCGVCDGHHYECFWGIVSAGDSADPIRQVLAVWTEWANGHCTVPALKPHAPKHGS